MRKRRKSLPAWKKALKLAGLVSDIWILLCAEALLFPHTITIRPSAETDDRSDPLNFNPKACDFSCSAFEALSGVIELEPQDVAHYDFKTYDVKSGKIRMDENKVTSVFSDSAIEAVYQPVLYSVDLCDDGHEVKKLERTYGKSVPLPTDGVNQEKHPYENFAGWKHNGGSTRKEVPADAGTDVTVAAQWSGKKYQIRYELNGGQASNPDSYVYGKGVAKLNDAFRSDYIFDGWYVDQNCTKRVTLVDQKSHGDLTLYAAFHPVPTPTPTPVRTPVPVQRSVPAQQPISNPAPAPAPAPVPAPAGIVWTAVPGDQSTIDQHVLVQYAGFQNYFATHNTTSYGQVILGLKAGDQVTVNGRTAVIDGGFSLNRFGVTVESVLARVPGGASSPVFQTCLDNAGNVAVKYGHYI